MQVYGKEPRRRTLSVDEEFAGRNEMPPEDMYGLNYCWELEMNEAPRAPKKRAARAGRRLLGI